MKKDNLIFSALIIICILMFSFNESLGLLFTSGFVLFLLFKRQWILLSAFFLFLLIFAISSGLMNYGSHGDLAKDRTICFYGSLSFVLLIYKQYKWVAVALAVGIICFFITDYDKYDRADYYQAKKINDNSVVSKP